MNLNEQIINKIFSELGQKEILILIVQLAVLYCKCINEHEGTDVIDNQRNICKLIFQALEKEKEKQNLKH